MEVKDQHHGLSQTLRSSGITGMLYSVRNLKRIRSMKTVIEMARDAGFYDGEIGRAEDAFERFAELVRAQENEACALIADEAEPYNAADLIRKRVKK
jgi:hypothetical protein